MPKNTTETSVITSQHTANGKPANGAKRKLRHKPFDQMTLEELTLFGFQLAYEQHQQQLSEQAGEQTDEQVHT